MVYMIWWVPPKKNHWTCPCQTSYWDELCEAWNKVPKVNASRSQTHLNPLENMSIDIWSNLSLKLNNFMQLPATSTWFPLGRNIVAFGLKIRTSKNTKASSRFRSHKLQLRVLKHLLRLQFVQFAEQWQHHQTQSQHRSASGQTRLRIVNNQALAGLEPATPSSSLGWCPARHNIRLESWKSEPHWQPGN